VGDDSVFVAEREGQRVTRIDKLDGGKQSAGFDAAVNSPWGVALEDGGLDAGARLAYSEARGGAKARVGVCTAAACGMTTNFDDNNDNVHGLFIQGGTLYWGEATGEHWIKSCALSDCSGTVSQLRSGEDGAWSILVQGATAYWTRHGTPGRLRGCMVSTCSLAASDLASGSSDWEGLALDGTTIFWAENGGNEIRSCTLNGLNACTPALFANASRPHAVLLDGQRIYWTNGVDTTGSVQWCPSTGCANQTGTTLAAGQDHPHGLAADSLFLYWTNETGGQLMRVRKPR
jgi:hypothetical protein